MKQKADCSTKAWLSQKTLFRLEKIWPARDIIDSSGHFYVLFYALKKLYVQKN